MGLSNVFCIFSKKNHILSALSHFCVLNNFLYLWVHFFIPLTWNRFENNVMLWWKFNFNINSKKTNQNWKIIKVEFERGGERESAFFKNPIKEEKLPKNFNQNSKFIAWSYFHGILFQRIEFLPKKWKQDLLSNKIL